MKLLFEMSLQEEIQKRPSQRRQFQDQCTTRLHNGWSTDRYHSQSREFFKAGKGSTGWNRGESNLKKIIEYAERDIIRRAPAKDRGNISIASEELELKPKGLTNKIDRCSTEIDFE